MKTQEFNPVSILQTDEEIAKYLTESYADNDPNVFIVALGNVVKQRGLTQIARDTGLNRESLYKAFSGNVQPKWDTVSRLLKSLGLSVDIAA